VINTVSSAGLQGQASQTNYGAAKAGIAAMTRIASLELGRYGVRVNAIAPGGFTRMVGQAMKDIEVKEPDEYTAFDRMNPGNSAPMVVWLASDKSDHVSGMVFRALGNSIALYKPWALQPAVEAKDKDGNPMQWDPAQITDAVNGDLFGSQAVPMRFGG
jgi:NAD(P)-dependent dehydrogenase (short-subunit alcohol dehydrogenase family)